jgi:hypothetical protein
VRGIAWGKSDGDVTARLRACDARGFTCSYMLADVVHAPEHGLNFWREKKVDGRQVQMIHTLFQRHHTRNAHHDHDHEKASKQGRPSTTTTVQLDYIPPAPTSRSMCSVVILNSYLAQCSLNTNL